MLTQLFIEGKAYDALHLLALMQQVWPKSAKPSGSGDTPKGWSDPWTPTTAAEWYWCAKRMAQDLARREVRRQASIHRQRGQAILAESRWQADSHCRPKRSTRATTASSMRT